MTRPLFWAFAGSLSWCVHPIFNVHTLKTAGAAERNSTGSREMAMKILTLPFRNHVLFVCGQEPVCIGLACRWDLTTR